MVGVTQGHTFFLLFLMIFSLLKFVNMIIFSYFCYADKKLNNLIPNQK